MAAVGNSAKNLPSGVWFANPFAVTTSKLSKFAVFEILPVAKSTSLSLVSSIKIEASPCTNPLIGPSAMASINVALCLANKLSSAA